MGKGKKKIVFDEISKDLETNPFASLELDGLPENDRQPATPAPSALSKKPVSKSRGRLDIIREKSGRGGKTVTVIRGFKGISSEEKSQLARKIQKRCGVGGAVKQGNIEIQGDRRDDVREILEAAGFKGVFAGG